MCAYVLNGRVGMDCIIKKNNVALYYTFVIARTLLFYIPVLVVFFNEELGNPVAVSTILAVNSISVFIFEVPSGYIADKIGRKNILMTSIIINIIALAILIAFRNYVMLLIAEILFGLSQALASGADDALIFDNLKAEGREKYFDVFVRNVSLITSFILAISFIVGSVMYSIIRESVFYLTIFSLIVALVAVISTKEHAYEEEKKYENRLLLDVKAVFSESFKLKFILIYCSIVISIFSAIYMFLYPLILHDRASSSFEYGVIYCVSALVVGFGAKMHAYIKRDMVLLVTGAAMLLPLCLIAYLLSWKYIPILFVIVMRFIWGMYNTSVSICINHELSKSSIRATVLSISSGLTGVSSCIIINVFGFLVKYNTYQSVFGKIAMIVLVISLVGVCFYIKMVRKNVVDK